EAAAPAPQPQAERAAEPPPGAKVVQVKDIAGSATKGPANAKVTIVEWSDFECPFCARAVPTIERILKEYPNDVRFVFKHQPLSFHPNARPPASAAEAAGQQGKFWEMHDKLFANMRALTQDNFKPWARELGLNMAKFEAALNVPKLAAKA